MDETPWRTLAYTPALATLTPDALLAVLRPGARVLEIGCGTGAVCRLLADHGTQVIGLDVSDTAIAVARELADVGNPAFITADVRRGLGEAEGHTFDAVLMIRVLTCFPDEPDRRGILARAEAVLDPGGVLYVRDFLVSDRYRARYAEAQRAGMSAGNFPVLNQDGSFRFIAHHHTEAEARGLFAAYDLLSFRIELSLSMNGHPVRMFEALGRRRP